MSIFISEWWNTVVSFVVLEDVGIETEELNRTNLLTNLHLTYILHRWPFPRNRVGPTKNDQYLRWAAGRHSRQHHDVQRCHRSMSLWSPMATSLGVLSRSTTFSLGRQLVARFKPVGVGLGMVDGWGWLIGWWLEGHFLKGWLGWVVGFPGGRIFV